MGGRSIILWICVFFLFLPALFTGCELRKENPEVRILKKFIADLENRVSDESESVSLSVDSLLSVTNDSMTYYTLLVLKAKSKLFMSELDSSVMLLREAESFCDSHSSDRDVTLLYVNIFNTGGNIYARSGNFDSAVWAFEKARQYASSQGTTEILVDVSLNLADAYIRKGRYDLCAYWYNYALSVADSISLSDEKRFPIYYGLAHVNMELRDFVMCDYYYNLAARYYGSMRPYEKHIYLNNRGNSYYYRQDYEEALEYFRSSLLLTMEHEEMEYERNLTMVNLGEVFMLLDQKDSASYYLNQCYRFFSSVNNASALYYIDTQLIELALKEGDISRARHLLEKTKNTANIEPNMVSIRNRYLAHYFESVGDYRNAYEYQKQNWRIDDSIRNERVKMRAAEIALKYKHDSTLMKQEFIIEQRESQVVALYQWIWGIVLGGLLLATAVIATVYYRRMQRKKKFRILEMSIASLRLENIRNRISPHFIFNVLDREVNLHKGYETSSNLLGLIKLLRRNLELANRISVSLADELDFVNTYVQLEKRSLGDDFEYRLETDGRLDADTVMIPAMLLQIPVENAIKHGLRMKEGKRLLMIQVRQGDGEVVLSVCDNGGGYRSESVNQGTRTGMKVITQTIQLLNSCNNRPITVTVNDVPVGDDGCMGCEVRYVVPLDYSYSLKKA